MRFDQQTEKTLLELAAKKHITKSEVIRQLVGIGLQQELAKESVDYIRDQIHAEIKSYCDPQFNRMAKLTAKIGYRSVSCFTLLALIMQDILPSNMQSPLDETIRKAKVQAIEYLQCSPEEFSDIMISEKNAIKTFENN